jgi:hypothetical protein
MPGPKSPIAARVLRRFTAAKALDPERLKAMLMKMRKGVGSFSFPQWQAVLETLGGWRIEPIVGLITLHLEDLGGTNAPISKLEEVKSHEVSTLPTNPVAHMHYTMDISEPWTLAPERGGGSYFKYKHWIGSVGARFISPEGKIFELFPGRYDIARGNDLRPEYRQYKLKDLDPSRGLVKWLTKETSLMDQISNYLGVPTFERERADKKEQSAPRTRNGTGTCPCCFRNIKLKDKSNELPKMVLHGYKRPGWGAVQGRCYGVAWPPYELSSDGTKNLVKVLGGQKKSYQELLHRLQSGAIKSLRVERNVYSEYKPTTKIEEIEPGHPEWDRVLKSRITETERILDAIKRDLVFFKEKVGSWKLAPLPMEGDKIQPVPKFLL